MVAGLKALFHRVLRAWGYDLVQIEEAWTIGPHLRTLLVVLGINCVIDVGAHTGEFGLFLRDLGYTGEIVSLEPLAASMLALARLLARDPRWRGHQLALGDRDDSVELHVTARTEFASFLTPNDYAAARFGGRVEVQRSEPVLMRKLDTVFDSLVAHVADPRIFLKLDTQGFDLTVLEGAQNCLQHVVALQSELSVKPIYGGMTSFLDALPRFRDLGFEVTGLFPVTRERDGLRVIELDCVMMRPPATPTS
jgi:FkbM family methyltransferase